MVDLVACDPPHDVTDARWLAAEGRDAAPPAEDAVPTAMERAGFAIHVVEDAGARHRQAVIEGWRNLLQALQDGDRPDPPAAAALVAEAEAWLLRLRLLKEGRLRLLRWHASMMARPPGRSWRRC